ncbi:eukaryotic translation initiation factor 3 subunit G isoform X1 [Prionailurus bengalensis]|uniref:eukaryotic translation initiation factor 3 subunit G isoform X1 n=1 Tax=Prionailurus bengalensis TaxID=37029 RepID=UPI001CA83782|nr:eukaryotic translation initiation factor 3 subunit G isoform X1 [Prionailurus bengalensis]
MPTGDFDSKPSWADQVEEEGEDDKCVTSELLKGIPLATGDTSPEPELVPGAPLPPPKEVINGNIKTVTEYKIDEDGKKFKIVRTFRIETRKASKAVARRKNWKKFGNSEFDPPGPNVATTTVSDDVSMTFITSKEDLNCQEEEDPMNKLKGQKIVSCRICKGDHWTTRCPYKDTLGPMQKELAEQLGLSTGEKEKLPGELEPVQAAQNKTGKYVPPSLRDGASRRGESMQPNRRADDNATIRVTNLSEDTRETDLQELFRPFGSISRIYLAKDKTTGQSKVGWWLWGLGKGLPGLVVPLTLPPAPRRVLPSLASTAVRMPHVPSPGCLALDMTTSSLMSSGPSRQPTKPAATRLPGPPWKAAPPSAGLPAIKRLRLSRAVLFIHLV